MTAQTPGPPHPAPSPTPPSVRGSTTLVSRAWSRTLRALGADPTDPADPRGRWPTTLQTLLWDLSPSRLAPSNDGVIAPAVEYEPWFSWLQNLKPDDSARGDNRLIELIEAERRRHAQARESAVSAEGKASRLLTPCVGLLAGAVAFTSWQLYSIAQARTNAGTVYLLLAAIPGVIGIAYLVCCIVRALDTDIRAGIYQGSGAAQLVASNGDLVKVLRYEHEAAQLARWTAAKKITKVMYARAALSRALVSLVAALILAAFAIVLHGRPNTVSSKTPTPTPSASPTTPARSAPPTRSPTPRATPKR